MTVRTPSPSRSRSFWFLMPIAMRITGGAEAVTMAGDGRYDRGRPAAEPRTPDEA